MKVEVLRKWQENPFLISSIVSKSLEEEIKHHADPIILVTEVV